MKRQGIIIGMGNGPSPEYMRDMLDILERRYPNVTFTAIQGANGHLAFDYDDGKPCDGPPVTLDPEPMSTGRKRKGHP